MCANVMSNLVLFFRKYMKILPAFYTGKYSIIGLLALWKGKETMVI